MVTSGDNIAASVDSIEEMNNQLDNIQNLSEISKNSRTTFIAILLAVAYSYLTIGTTTDAALFSNSVASPLPIIQAQVPIVWFYYFAPLILFLLYFYLHIYLQRFWRCVAALPLRHKDGRSLDEYIYPWIISAAFLRAEIPELHSEKSFHFPLEAAISIFLAWWLIPLMLVIFWARYLTVHDWTGTAVHIALIVMSVAGAIRFYYAAKNAVNTEHLLSRSNNIFLRPNSLVTLGSLFSLVVLGFCTYGTIEGAPKKECTYSELSQCSFVYSGVRLLELIGYNPFANFEGSKFMKPDNWWELATSDKFKEQLSEMIGPDFKKKDLRFTNGNRSFLVRADFRQAKMQQIKLDNAILVHADFSDANLDGGILKEADLRWANLSKALLRNTDLTQANLKYCNLNGTDFTDSQLNGADLDHAIGIEVDFTSADLRFANLTSVQFPRAKMINTDLQKANLTGAQLESSNFNNATLQSANFFEASLSDSVFDNANLESAKLKTAFIDEAKFLNTNLSKAEMQSVNGYKANFTDAKLMAAKLNNADLRSAIFTNANLTDASLDGADLANSVFDNAVLKRTNFGNSQLHGAMFRNSNLSGAILSNTKGFDLANLDGSCGDSHTKLPAKHKITLCSDKTNNIIK